MIDTPAQPFTFEGFLTQYGDNARYELADGDLIDAASRLLGDPSSQR
jgi:hypothetical protein